jgi:isoamylase
MDSLRYWVLEMHVDGFRLDLASALARQFFELDRLGAFFDVIDQDPVISQVKLIAEPWDLGPGGIRLVTFPSYGRSGMVSIVIACGAFGNRHRSSITFVKE